MICETPARRKLNTSRLDTIIGIVLGDIMTLIFQLLKILFWSSFLIITIALS